MCQFLFLSLLWFSVHPDQCNVGATHSSHSPGTGEGEAGGRWGIGSVGGLRRLAACWPLVLLPPLILSSYFVCHVIMLPCRQVTVDADCGAVVLVPRRHESQAIGVDLMAGGPVSLGRLRLTLAKLPITQSLQHLSTDLQHTETHRHSVSE